MKIKKQNILFTLAEAIIMAFKILILMVIIGAVFAAWFSLSFYIWGQYGGDTFTWWLTGSALLVALLLVALW